MTLRGEGRTLEEAIKRIKKATIEIEGHWLFQGANTRGYGQIKYCYKMVAVHRISAAYYLELDLNDSTQQANHKITCIHKNCWNPDHLYIGTQADNTRDTSICGDARSGGSNATHCIREHEFTKENTYVDKHGKRSCKICRRNAGKQYRELRGRI